MAFCNRVNMLHVETRLILLTGPAHKDLGCMLWAAQGQLQGLR
jgi:hypothetical protein